MPRRGGDNFVPTGISESNLGGTAVACARSAGDELVKSDGVVFLPFVETSSVMASGTGTCLVL